MGNKEKSTPSERKIRLLNDTINMLQNMIDACEDIKSGIPENTTLYNHNINQAIFRNIVFNEKLGFEESEPPLSQKELLEINEARDEDGDDIGFLSADMLHTPAEFLSWEERLYMAVFGTNNLRDIPRGLEESIPIVLRSLTERERTLILYRFKESMILSEIGSKFNLSKERCRQIIVKALGKLRHPDRANILRYGSEYASLVNMVRHAKADKIVSYHIDKIRKQYDEIIESNDKEAIISLYKVIAGTVASYHILPNDKSNLFRVNYSDNIDELELSVRPYNCLYRAGILTIDKLIKLDYDELIHIRNLGKKSAQEIIDKCIDMNIPAKFLGNYTSAY